MSEVIKSGVVKIRKAHKCVGCFRLFEKGNELTSTTFVDCGEISTCYWCPDCMKESREYDDDDGYEEGCFREQLMERYKTAGKTWTDLVIPLVNRGDE